MINHQNRPTIKIVRISLLCFVVIALAFCESDADLVVSESTPYEANTNTLVDSINLELFGGMLDPLLERGCKLPCSITKTFSTAMDGQGQITITLFQGDSSTPSEAKRLGKFMISGISPAPRGQPQVTITIRATKDNVTISAGMNRSSGKLTISRVD